MFRKKGFTLAEVLITLGIIGMIAEMTIPTLMNNVGNQVFKVGLKKSYSVLSQATVDVMNENSGTMVGVSTTGNNGLRDAYAPFLNFSKTCSDGQAGCFWISGQFKNLDNSTVNWWAVDSSVILNDGSIVDFYLQDTNCKYTGWGGTNDCGYFSVDVNGAKKPNQIGKDIYFFYIQENGIKPFGVYDNSTDCIIFPPTGRGCGCAYKYLYQ